GGGPRRLLWVVGGCWAAGGVLTPAEGPVVGRSQNASAPITAPTREAEAEEVTMSQSKWLFAILLGPDQGLAHWSRDCRRVEVQNGLLGALRASLGNRRWFFRRAGLEEEGVARKDVDSSLCIYVECFRGESRDNVVALLQKGLPEGWSLYRPPRCHSGPFSEGSYPWSREGQRAMTDLCCAVTRAMVTNSDPSPRDVAKWLSWLFGVPNQAQIEAALGLQLTQRE
ncbi:MAG: hypothetical protein ACE5R4_17670, partial [Armatimonadota bacterium]